MTRTYIIAELSANHGGELEIVKKTMYSAKECGADAIKIQTFTPDSLSINSEKDHFKIREEESLWYGRTLYSLYTEGALPYEWHEEIFRYGKEIGIDVFSTPFCLDGVDFLKSFNPPYYKIASFEINDIPLIKKAASIGKPMIISTGIATFEDIENAVEACRSVGNNEITLLRCTSEYPAKIEDSNMLMMLDMKEKFSVVVGLSDHTEGSLLPVIAVSMGAKVIEKHFILDKKIGGPDASFSMEPKEFADMVKMIRNTEASMGKIDYEAIRRKKSRYYRRSLYFVSNLKKGDTVSDKDIRSARPCIGIEPIHLEEIIGKKVSEDVEYGDPVKFEDIENI